MQGVLIIDVHCLQFSKLDRGVVVWKKMYG